MALASHLTIRNGEVTPPKLDTAAKYSMSGLSACMVSIGDGASADPPKGILSVISSNSTSAWFESTSADGRSDVIIKTPNKEWHMSSSGGNAGHLYITTSGADSGVIYMPNVVICAPFGIEGPSTASTAYFDDGTAGDPSISFSSDLDTGLYRSGTDELSVSTSGIQRMVFAAGCYSYVPNDHGLVIGNTSQAAAGGITSEMQIQGTADADASTMIQRYSADTSGGILGLAKSRGAFGTPGTTVVTGDDVGQIRAFADDGTDMAQNTARIAFGVEGTVAGNRTPGNIRFITAADAAGSALAERLRIDSAGNVGIGTASPGGRLHAYTGDAGAVTPNAAADEGVFEASGDGGISILVPDGNNANLYFGNPTGTNDDGIIRYAYNAGSQFMDFFVATDRKMRIDNSGNVGIGTASPVNRASYSSLSLGGVGNMQSLTAAAASGSMFLGANAYHNGTNWVRNVEDESSFLLMIDGQTRFYNNTSGAAGTFTATERLRIDSAGNVGIGVTPSGWQSIQTALQIGGNAALWHETAQGASGTFAIGQNVNKDTDGTFEYISTDEASYYRQSGGSHAWFTAASGSAGNDISWTEVMRTDTSGHVGIGTASPGQVLDVAGDTDVSAAIGRAHVGYDGANSDVAIFAHADHVSNTNRALWQDANGVTALNAASGQNLRFRINNADVMRIDQNGNVGINDTAPDADLMIKADAAGSDIFAIERAASTQRFLLLKDVANDPDLEIFKGDGSTFFKIDNSGNVGIGTASPVNRASYSSLSLGGVGNMQSLTAAAASGSMFLGANAYHNGTNWVRNVEDESSFLLMIDGQTRFYNNTSGAAGTFTATERLRIDSAGNVGIGTTTPAVPLTVEISDSNTGSIAASAGQYALELANTDGTNDTWAVLNFSNEASAGTPTAAIGVQFTDTGNDYGDLVFATRSAGGWSEKVRIDEAGNVGIGTASPSSYDNDADQFVIYKNGKAGMTIAGATTGQSNIFFADATSGGGSYTGTIRYDHTDNFMMFRVNEAERLRIDSSGNVGIGTSSPSYNIHADNTSGGTIALTRDRTGGAFDAAGYTLGIVNLGGEDSDSGADYDAAQIVVQTSQAWTAGAHGTKMSFQTTNDDATSLSTRMVIDGSGNVGIGTATPGWRLEVNGNGLVVGVKADATHYTYLYPGTTGGNTPSIGYYSVLRFYDDDGTGETMRIDTAGNVGIGTASPAVKLTVSGAICSTGAITIGTTSTLTGISTHVAGICSCDDIGLNCHVFANGCKSHSVQFSLRDSANDVLRAYSQAYGCVNNGCWATKCGSFLVDVVINNSMTNRLIVHPLYVCTPVAITAGGAITAGTCLVVPTIYATSSICGGLGAGQIVLTPVCCVIICGITDNVWSTVICGANCGGGTIANGLNIEQASCITGRVIFRAVNCLAKGVWIDSSANMCMHCSFTAGGSITTGGNLCVDTWICGTTNLVFCSASGCVAVCNAKFCVIGSDITARCICSTANTCVGGTLGKAAGSFVINHPCENKKKPNKYNAMNLIHGFEEGPKYGIFYEGEGTLCNGIATVQLPSYFNKLVNRKDGIYIQITGLGEWTPLTVMNSDCPVCSDKFKVCTVDTGVKNAKFSWRLSATRGDEYVVNDSTQTDDDGKLIVEQWKNRAQIDNTENVIAALTDSELDDWINYSRRTKKIASKELFNEESEYIDDKALASDISNREEVLKMVKREAIKEKEK